MMRWLIFFITMIGIAKAQPFNGDSDYFIEAWVDNPAPFVGEQITYTIRYYAIDQEGITPQFPDFEGFWIGEATTLPTIVRNIGNNQYFVREIQIFIAPLSVGELVIGESRLVVTGDVFRSEQILTAPAIPITVRPLPDNAPASFLGAVGEFVMSANFDADILMLGNPFTLQIDIQGIGILDTISPPTITMPSDWQIFPQTPLYQQPNVGVPLGNKRFEWVIIPATIGTYPIEPIEWAYFDTRSQTYVVLSTPAFTLDILPNENGDVRLSAVNGNNSNLLLPLKTDGTNGLWLSGTWWRLGWLVMPILVAGGVIIGVYQKRRDKRNAQKRYKTALSRAQKRLQSVKKQPNPQKMSAVIYAYIADKSDSSLKLVASSLADYVAHKDQLLMINGLLSRIQSVSYMPDGVQYDFEPLFADMRQVLAKLDQSWDKSA
ncbi:MAG: BatD family protein [Anaerolineae bacterium]|nr:BatD family protein [Anaerolineae bacterium]